MAIEPFGMQGPLDIIGGFLWILMFASPLIVFPFVWRLSRASFLKKCLYTILLSIPLSFACYFLSIAIIFRDGMGP